MYWYSIELPSQIEYNTSDYEYPYPRVYQFLDYSQGTLFPARNNTDVEGAVACFFYSLWDGVSRRAPNYYGDNDDITFSGAFILNNLANRYNVLGQLLESTHIESYKMALLNTLDNQNDASVNALYNSIILKNGMPKSATPTSLSVSGNNSSRNLSWNDNTCPSSVSYQEESGSNRTFNLVQNQEQGFRIYRKATTSSWDGTLNGYTHVGTVGQNTTTWTDNTSLSGRHSYVVVAYNSAGNSLPRAENSVYYQPALTVSISGPTTLYGSTRSVRAPAPSATGTWTANPSGGTGTYSYQWYYKSNNSSTWYECYGGTSNTYTRTIYNDISFKCIVTSGSESAYAIINVSFVDPSLNKNNLISQEETILPEKTELQSNYPNPFNPSTTIRYQIFETGFVTLKVYDIRGQEVAKLVSEPKNAGYYSENFDASNLPSGVYLYTLQTGNYIKTNKMLLLK